MSEVIASLNFESGKSIEVTKDMARLYTHLGHNALYDHIFIVVDQEESQGVYIWAQEPPENPAYPELAPTIVENECEMHVFIREASQYDKEAFERAVTRDKDETPNWLPGV